MSPSASLVLNEATTSETIKNWCFQKSKRPLTSGLFSSLRIDKNLIF